jgi:hypothetical protein
MLSVSIVRSDVGERIAQRTADAYRARPQVIRRAHAGVGDPLHLDGVL